MMSKRVFCIALLCVLLMSLALAASARTVKVCFWSEGTLRIVQREVASDIGNEQAALYALVLGPTVEEQILGISSAIPPGTIILGIRMDDERIVIDFSRDIITPGFGDYELESIFTQVKWTLRLAGSERNILMTAEGITLSSYLPPTPYIEPRKDIEAQATGISALSAGSALSGRKISISPGHGYIWQGTAWAWQRGITCASTGLAREDDHNLEMTQYLEKYLLADGATVKMSRCTDKNYGNHSTTGQPWWKMAACYWLKNAGYPCTVYGSSTGCTMESGTSEWNDDIRSRPLSSDYDSSDIFFSLHTNALSGDCTGSCPTGSDIFYDCSTEHIAWCDVSRNLQQAVYPAMLDTIRTKIPDADWNDHGVHEDTAGNYGEARIPDRAAVLLELGYHDTCDHDATHLSDNFFRSAAMWGIYKGMCTYFGVSPTWDFYSDEYVSDTIPTSLAPGQVCNVSITLRNRGVLWNSARNFKLGAVGDSDPFTSTTRYTLANEVGPGDTYTFNITLTAPSQTGTYVIDWQMLREGYQWFGAKVTKTITVTGSADTEPPTVPANLSGYGSSQTQIDLSWTASTDNMAVAGYRIYRNGSYIGSSPTNSYSDTGLSANTTYSYRVSAYDTTNNESAQCTAVGVTTPPSIEVIVDEEAATYTGSWTNSTSTPPTSYNGDYKYTISATSESATAKWYPSLTRTGNWKVYIYYREGSNRPNTVPYTVYYNGGSQTYTIDQTTGGGQWLYLGTHTFESGTTGYVKISNNTGTAGLAVIADAVKLSYANDIRNNGPSITSQPSSVSVCPGSNTSFAVEATGSGTLSYQWKKGTTSITNGGHYSGATTATLTVSSVDQNDAADNYNCVVTDNNGSTTSSYATLTVKTATSITTNPSNQVVNAGNTAQFSVVAAGTNLTYQWKKNGSNLVNGGDISGATSDILSIANCESSDAGTYSCAVTGDCGTATSNGATLTVNAGPVTRLFDNFDSYASTANFTAAWPASVSPGLSISTTQKYSGTQSVYASTSALQNYKDFTAVYATDANPINWSIRLYDNNTSNLDRQWVDLMDYSPSITQLLCIGKCNSDNNMRYYYAARIAYSPGTGWVLLNDAGAPGRSIGWHELKAVIKGTTIDYYVDGTLAKSNVSYCNSVGTHTFDRARIGSGYTSTSAAYYDDFSVTGGN